MATNDGPRTAAAVRAAEGEVHGLGDRALAVAVRCGSTAAVREFVLRFRPMLVAVASRFVRAEGEGDELADDVLLDTLRRLADVTAPMPTSVRGYLVRAFRNRATNAARAATRRRCAGGHAADASGDAEPQLERAVTTCASEHSVRASHGPAWDGPPGTPPALARLAAALTETLSADERLLVTWLAHHVPQQQIATWLGVSYDATSKRVRRVRARLHRLAQVYAARAEPTDRLIITAFLERAAAIGRPSPAATGSDKGARSELRGPRAIHQRSSSGGAS